MGLLRVLNLSDTVIELRTAIETYKTNEKSYQERLESTEIARATAARGEAFGAYFLIYTYLNHPHY